EPQSIPEGKDEAAGAVEVGPEPGKPAPAKGGGTPCTHWAPLEELEGLLPYKEHVAKDGDTFEALAKEAGLGSAAEFLKATFGSGKPNRRRVANPNAEGPA